MSVLSVYVYPQTVYRYSRESVYEFVILCIWIVDDFQVESRTTNGLYRTNGISHLYRIDEYLICTR
jgi:hypothetical protein